MRRWRQREGGAGWDSDDGAAVVNHNPMSMRPWIAFPPGSGEYNYLEKKHYTGECSGGPRYWATAETAMKAINREYPQPRGEQKDDT